MNQQTAPATLTAADGTTLTITPAGLPDDPGCAEIIIRIAAPGRPAVEAAVLSRDLPAMIDALTGNRMWSYSTIDDVAVEVAPFGGGGMLLILAADPDAVEEQPQIHIPEEQRQPLASALSRALDVARSWED